MSVKEAYNMLEQTLAEYSIALEFPSFTTNPINYVEGSCDALALALELLADECPEVKEEE